MPSPAPAAVSLPSFAFDNSFARELEGFYVSWAPAAAPAPRLVYFDDALARELGLNVEQLDAQAKADIFSGNALPAGAEPLAQVYAGHQFGGFSPRLGDGRALLVGEVIDRHGERRDIAFKGSGRTPFARGGDGKAALGPMLREVVVSECMHALGMPTTRALAVVATGEPVYREAALPGAVLTRVAASHLRVGTFEYFAARREHERVRRLADYAIARHYPAVATSSTPYLDLLQAVAERQARLVARWMNVGFIHGVMNTDNMTISGETIDYGPCAFMEAYDPGTVFSSIDEHGRYAYGNQPAIAQWNLARFAETLLPLLDGDRGQAIERATPVIVAFKSHYERALLEGQRIKLGLRPRDADAATDADDAALAADWLALLQAGRVDFTLAWRRLADAANADVTPLRMLMPDAPGLDAWLARWHQRCREEDIPGSGSDGNGVTRGGDIPGNDGDAADRSGDAAKGDDRARGNGDDADAAARRAAAMRCANPLVIARNHRVEEALAAASAGDLEPFERLLAAVRHPYADGARQAPYAEPASAEATANYRTFCGT